jgi:hypothetical protein
MGDVEIGVALRRLVDDRSKIGQTYTFDPTTGVLAIPAAAPVPEPVSLGVLVLGALALTRRRRA